MVDRITSEHTIYTKKKKSFLRMHFKFESTTIAWREMLKGIPGLQYADGQTRIQVICLSIKSAPLKRFFKERFFGNKAKVISLT